MNAEADPEARSRDGTGDAPDRRPGVMMLPGHTQRVEAGHPWVFSNEVRMDAAAKALPPGGLVTLRRPDERPLGVAMFNPHTLLAARLLDRDAQRAIDRRFFFRRFERALRLRARLFAEPFYRLVHAEADGLPGLIVDRFQPDQTKHGKAAIGGGLLLKGGEAFFFALGSVSRATLPAFPRAQTSAGSGGLAKRRTAGANRVICDSCGGVAT